MGDRDGGNHSTRRAALAGAALAVLASLTGLPGTPAGAAPAPRDSVSGAREQLDAARAQAEALRAESAALELTATAERRDANARDADRRAERNRRIGRAVVLYRGSRTVVPFDRPQRQGLELRHSQRLFDAADRRSRTVIDRLEAQAEYLRASATAHEVRMVEARNEAVRVEEQADTLAHKLANWDRPLGVMAKPLPISAARTPVARAADVAARALQARTSIGWQTDPGWLGSRHELAKVLARGEAGAREMELAWDATPRPALEAVLAALRQVGKPYVYATAGAPTFDCSGLTLRAYAEAGMRLPHFSAAQLRLGAPVRVADLRPGDLLAYGPDGADHVAMYLGGGQAVEARSSQSGVVVNAARTGGTFAGATRLVP